MAVTLSPTQDQARHRLLKAVRSGHIGVLTGQAGMGKTTILRDVHAETGGQFLGMRELMTAMDRHHPLALEDAMYDLLFSALAAHDVVIMDDLHLLADVLCCGHFYPRNSLLRAPLTALVGEARSRGKQLILAFDGINFAAPWGHQQVAPIGDFTPADYEHLCRAHLERADADALDVTRIHRYARKLTAAQLRSTCLSLRESGTIDTDRFIDHLRAHHLAANVDLREVQAVDLDDLKGLDDVLEALEANVVLPLENAELVAELGLTPKRGVLLAGPPGTGKTTIGRALAHRLKSKFFLIDGTVISGTSGFFPYIHQVFESAKRNAPSIIFIDDSDVLFEGNAEAGFYRFLLTILDGIESESVGHVCLMMTAMDVGSLPPALVRSGRIELWLEMSLPNEAARAAILADRCAGLPATMGAVDLAGLAAATDGLSGADLKRMIDDGKLLYAYDASRGRPLLAAGDYFLRAIDTVRANKQRYAEAEARARAHRPNRPSFFDFAEMAAVEGMGAVHMDSMMVQMPGIRVMDHVEPG
jgi:ATP-dependent 26S proteasome regulatory subunit